MKKLFFLLLLSNLAFSQPDVEIRLVNAGVGTPSCGYFMNDWLCNITNDSGLNTIFSNYGVTFFREKGGHPYPAYVGRILSIPGTFPAQFITDLQAYSSVVADAGVSDMGWFRDSSNIELVDANVGIPIGTSGNIIVTNDSGLNQLFQTYNVFYYALTYPSAGTAFLKYYSLVCNCNASELQLALNNYSTVIANAYGQPAVYLSNEVIQKPQSTVSPNPFSNYLNIETDQLITHYAIIDFTGKTIVSTASKNELDFKIEQLNTGLYILNLQFESGQTFNHKLIKK
ncbi:T9SS type A sorting domain-containing protein [Flavobacterium buctense]|uniref:T9SS type A sorting domain-containing protein n=1 Tax=Flavobacterium buctense TaxID=1648146 RepID=A0ABU9E176_9FLAO|nr:T9SS type A sorting domain-containing protein [Flavobacterium buctense]